MNRDPSEGCEGVLSEDPQEPSPAKLSMVPLPKTTSPFLPQRSDVEFLLAFSDHTQATVEECTRFTPFTSLGSPEIILDHKT